ncbi:MAG: hypothetical protein WC011_01515 [Candidatus Paceibacterota bacterium]
MKNLEYFYGGFASIVLFLLFYLLYRKNEITLEEFENIVFSAIVLVFINAIIFANFCYLELKERFKNLVLEKKLSDVANEDNAFYSDFEKMQLNFTALESDFKKLQKSYAFSEASYQDLEFEYEEIYFKNKKINEENLKLKKQKIMSII